VFQKIQRVNQIAFLTKRVGVHHKLKRRLNKKKLQLRNIWNPTCGNFSLAHVQEHPSSWMCKLKC